MTIPASPESRDTANRLIQWHFAATASGAPVVEKPPEIIAGEEAFRAEWRAMGGTVVSSTRPVIPPAVSAEYKAIRDEHPSVSGSTDKSHITLAYERGRGNL